MSDKIQNKKKLKQKNRTNFERDCFRNQFDEFYTKIFDCKNHFSVLLKLKTDEKIFSEKKFIFSVNKLCGGRCLGDVRVAFLAPESTIGVGFGSFFLLIYFRQS